MTGIPNTDAETGVRYGVIASNSLASWVFEEAMQSGEDIDHTEAVDDLRDGVKAAIGYKDFSKDRRETLDSLIEDLVNECLEDYESTGDQTRYRYETTHDGQPLVMQFTGSCEMWVFKSPIIVNTRECSPCFPKAGNLDEPSENGVPTYGLPPEWLYSTESA